MKRKLIIYNIFIVLIMLSATVYAATSAKLNLVLTPQNASIRPGEKITVKLSLKDFDQETNGIDSISGYIDIDENVVKDITVSNIVKTNKQNETVKIGNEDLMVYDVNNLGEGIPDKGIFLMKDPADADHDYKLTIDLSSSNKIKTEDIIEIEFETKENTEEKTYNDVIKYVDFEATGGWTESIDIQDNQVSIVLTTQNNPEDPGNDDDNNQGNGDHQGDNNQGDDNNQAGNDKPGNTGSDEERPGNGVNKTSQGNNIKDNTLANKNIPAAGTTNFIVKVVIAGAMVGFVIYVKYKKYKNI